MLVPDTEVEQEEKVIGGKEKEDQLIIEEE